MADTSSGHPLIGERRITREGGSSRSDVVIRLREPEFAPLRSRGAYRCAFEIDGLDAPIQGDGYGVDSMQAAIAANTQATYVLWPFRTQLRWLGGSYREIANAVALGDSGRRRQLRAIIDEEADVSEQMARERELMRRAMAVPAPPRSDANAATSRIDTARTSARRDTIVDEATRFAPVCTRRLIYNARSDVNINIWRPTAVAGVDDDYRCVFEVVGLGDGARRVSGGIDSMQALLLAMKGTTSILQPYQSGLTWFGLAYEDSALYPSVLDAGRQRRIEAIIDEELYAIEQLRRLREELRGENGPPRER